MGFARRIWGRRWRGGVVVVAALLPYLLLPGNPLLVDAPLAVTQNEAVRSGSPTKLFSVDFWGLPPDAPYGTHSYRPLVSLTYAAQLRVLGDAPWSFHVFDMMLHALAALLAILLAERLGLRPRWAMIAGLIFAVHPVQSEAVASVVGRADLMAGAFLLAALVLHLDTRPAGRWARTVGTVLCLACALLCKEYAVAFPFVLVAADLARRHDPTDRARRAGVAAAGLVLLAGYLLLRRALFGSLGGVPMLTEADHPLYGASWLTRWSTAAGLLLFSGRLLVFPLGLNHHYRIGSRPVLDGPFEPASLGGIVLALALIALAVVAARRLRDATPTVAVALFLFPLGPALNTVSLSGMLFAERHLYLPVCGFALLVAFAAQRLTSRERTAVLTACALAVLIVAGAGLTADRVLDWRSTERLSRSSLRAYPEGAEVWADLGIDLGKQGRHEEAAAALARAVELQPHSARAWQAYGIALAHLGRDADSAWAWRRSVENAPGESGALDYGLAAAELRAGNLEPAEAAARRAAGLLPHDAAVTTLLARILLARGSVDEAVAVLQSARDAAGRPAPSLERALGQALLLSAGDRLATGHPDLALERAIEAVGLETIPPEERFQAAVIAARAGSPDAARTWFDRALRDDPQLLRRKHDAALEHESRGRLRDAAETYREILLADPERVSALFNLGRVLLAAGRAEEAIEPLRRGLALRDDARARAMLGEARHEARAPDAR